MSTTTHRRAESGLTMIEAMISTTLLTIVLAPLGMLIETSGDIHRDVTSRSSTHTQARRAAGRIAKHLTGANLGSLGSFPEAPFWYDSITFDVVDSISPEDGTVTWSTVRVGRQLEPGEQDDGRDNDGDGLVDEGRVVLTLDLDGPEERDVILTRFVRRHLGGESADGNDSNGNGLTDEPGLCFTRRGNTLAIHVTVEKVASNGERAIETSRAFVTLRN